MGEVLIQPDLTGSMKIPKVTATAASGAATCNGYLCRITTESLTTAAAAEYTLTLTNNCIVAASTVIVMVGNGTNTGAVPGLGGVTPGAGSAVITVTNLGGSQANGTLIVDVLVINPAY